MRFFLYLTFTILPYVTFADDGHRLWLKYDLLENVNLRNEYTKSVAYIQLPTTQDPTLQVAAGELTLAMKGLLGISPTLVPKLPAGTHGLNLKLEKLADNHPEGYEIKNVGKEIIISANTSKGLLYGTFVFIQLLQQKASIVNLQVKSAPKVQLRMLNHWDNNNGTIERGYAGMSLWKWYELPERIDPRYIMYARANASVGINAVALNNVNASARFITNEYLQKVKALADVFRPYNIRVFLSVNFASPKLIGGLSTADPLDPDVKAWWKQKADEIYEQILDFGGFLVKANSEGEPGPMDYGRTHADGANMLAASVSANNGIVIWRAFVYKSDPKSDRFAAAYDEFKPFDGQFDQNVIIQVKNGPIDFQVREPISPLLGQCKKHPSPSNSS